MADRKLFHVEVTGHAREVYAVEAKSTEEATRIFADGDAGAPEISEITEAEVVEVRRDGSDAR